jgi:RimJ/RimL family protein N-acetyltransferase
MLRKGTDADFDALHGIYMEPSVNPYLSFEITGKDEFRPIFDGMTRAGQLYVYERDGTVAATCIVRGYDRRCRHVACLGTLAVHPAMQGKGIGAAFMRDMINELRGQGFRRVELFVEDDNLKARRFYESLGFSHEGVLKQFYKRANDDHYVDEHIMALLLAG